MIDCPYVKYNICCMKGCSKSDQCNYFLEMEALLPTNKENE